MINLLIIHYNTPELTTALIKSINKYVKSEYTIYLFDNSTTKPFTAKYNNLIYLDNTKGQYINFDEWLSQFPNRFNSYGGRVNNFASAKHTVSIQKFMDIFDDNFILLDSDVLLKKDISKLIDNKYIYIGQSKEEHNSMRVLPFLLFINNKMCKDNNIKFFDEKYMLGLCTTSESDKYDTGGLFYVNTRKLPYKEINLNNYIIHFRGGSWEEIKKIHTIKKLVLKIG